MFKKYQRRIRSRIGFLFLLIAVCAALVAQAYLTAPDVPWQAVSVGLAFGLLLGAALLHLLDAASDLHRLRKERDQYVVVLERKTY